MTAQVPFEDRDSRTDQDQMEDIAQALAKITKRSTEQVRPYLHNLVTQLQKSPLLSFEQIDQELEEIADLIPNVPPLSNADVDRDTIYTREEEW